METQLLHRGRLVDHIQLVVADLAASRAFYGAIFEVLGVPVGGEAEDYFWAAELFVSTKGSQAALGELTGRHHLAFQAPRSMVFTTRASRRVGATMARRASGPIIQAIMRPSCSTPTAIISRRSIMVRISVARRRWRSASKADVRLGWKAALAIAPAQPVFGA